MPEVLSVDNVFFTVLGSPVSYVEFVGTALYLWSVWLIVKRHILTWPVGMVSVLLYAALFYQIHLYSDTIEQTYYVGACIYGWWHWSKSTRDHGIVSGVGFSGWASIGVVLGITAVLSIADGAFMSRIHLFFPALFSERASFPYLDAVTTIMSFTAMLLMARKRTESWVYWIVVDVIGIGLYYAKDAKLVSLLYVLLLAMASKGLLDWTRAGRAGEADG